MNIDIDSVFIGLMLATIPQILIIVVRNYYDKDSLKYKAKLELENKKKELFSSNQSLILGTLWAYIIGISKICGSREFNNLIHELSEKQVELLEFCDSNKLYLTDELISLVNRLLECSEPARFNVDDFNELIIIKELIEKEIKKLPNFDR